MQVEKMNGDRPNVADCQYCPEYYFGKIKTRRRNNYRCRIHGKRLSEIKHCERLQGVKDEYDQRMNRIKMELGL